MASGNLALVFGAVLAGAVVVDYGTKAVKSAFAAAPAGAAPSSTPALTGGTGALAPGAAGKLNSSQQTFAARLQADTGLDPTVIAGWLLSEEPASSSNAPNGANNWLNIGSFDSGNWAGGGSNVWADPTVAADATASFIMGHSVNGVTAPMHASAGIRAILNAAGASVAEQIAAIQHSGWATSGYPDLASIVAEF